MDRGGETGSNLSVVFYKLLGKLCSITHVQYPQIIRDYCLTVLDHFLKTMSKKPPVIDIDPATLLFIGSLLILLPLLFTGFLSQ